MIYKKRYGQPFDTESVVGSFLPMMETIPYLTKEPNGFSYAMEPQDILYGLGENVRGINKRGWVYESICRCWTLWVCPTLWMGPPHRCGTSTRTIHPAQRMCCGSS